MDVTCVVDNGVQRGSRLWGEHGLAFLIEMGQGCALFDTGQSGNVLIHNLALLGFRPADVDVLALSHAHRDHTGGLSMLIQYLNPSTPLYANPDLFRERYAEKDGELEDVGLELRMADLAARLAPVLDGAEREIAPGIWTTGAMVDRPHAQGGSKRHRMRHVDELVPDAYLDDMGLVLVEDDGLTLLCGCCHAGLLNTVDHVERVFTRPIRIIAGGLHLTSADDGDLAGICDALAVMPALERVYPNHCTGEAAFIALRGRLGTSVVRPCPAGTVITL